jgi:hypothetical protein
MGTRDPRNVRPLLVLPSRCPNQTGIILESFCLAPRRRAAFPGQRVTRHGIVLGPDGVDLFCWEEYRAANSHGVEFTAHYPVQDALRVRAQDVRGRLETQKAHEAEAILVRHNHEMPIGSSV